MPVRVNRYLASTGLGSRRAVEELVREGRVTVNGSVADLATRVADGDDVRVDGEPVAPEAIVAVVLNKPRGRRHDGPRPAGPPDGDGPRRDGRAPLSRRPPRSRHDGRPAPHQRRRPGRPADAPSPRRPQVVPCAREGRAGRRCARATAGRHRARRRADGARRRAKPRGERHRHHDPRGPKPPGAADVRRGRASRDPSAPDGLRGNHRRTARAGGVARAHPPPRSRRCAMHDAVVVGAGISGLDGRPPARGRRRGCRRRRGRRAGRRPRLEPGRPRRALGGGRRGRRPREHPPSGAGRGGRRGAATGPRSGGATMARRRSSGTSPAAPAPRTRRGIAACSPRSPAGVRAPRPTTVSRWPSGWPGTAPGCSTSPWPRPPSR